MSVIYVTYDAALKRYLWNKCNIDTILYAKHPKTNKPLWVYERNQILEKALKDYFDERN